jgi:hypothetical protein
LKSKQHLFGKPEAVLSLEKLLTNQKLKLGYLEDMTYSKRVHELLEKNRHKGNIHFSSVNAVELNLSMLDRGHLDYFFGFSAQAIFNAISRCFSRQLSPKLLSRLFVLLWI